MSILSSLGKTTRRTSNRKIKAKIKPSKTKKTKKKRSVTSVLNSHKGIKKKIKLPRLRKKKGNQDTDGTQSGGSVLDGLTRVAAAGIELAGANAERKIGSEQDALSLNEKMDTPGNREHGYVNKDYDPDAGSFLSKEKTLEDVPVRSGKRKKKKDNTLLIVAIVAVAILAFLYFRKKK